jgi:hypothetical protein
MVSLLSGEKRIAKTHFTPSGSLTGSVTSGLTGYDFADGIADWLRTRYDPA